MQCVVCPFVFILVIVSSDYSEGVTEPDKYCGEEICGLKDLHTLCQYKAGPAPLCTDYVSHPLSQGEKYRILKRLNKRRKDAASRKLMNLPTAGNMLKLHWADDLADVAQRWADQCQPPSNPELNDACRDLKGITVGQTVASVVGDAPGLRVETMVDIWYLQSLLYRGNESVYLGPSHTDTYYGDFAQIVWSSTYLVGCGMAQFSSLVHGQQQVVYRLVCNFAPRGPDALQPLWSPGVPASKCPPNSSIDKESLLLCDFHFETAENVFDFKKFLGIKDRITTTEKSNLKSVKTNKRNKKSVHRALFGLDDQKLYDIEELIDPHTRRNDLRMSEDNSYKEIRYDNQNLTNKTTEPSNFKTKPILMAKKNLKYDIQNFRESIAKSYVIDNITSLEPTREVSTTTEVAINKTLASNKTVMSLITDKHNKSTTANVTVNEYTRLNEDLANRRELQDYTTSKTKALELNNDITVLKTSTYQTEDNEITNSEKFVEDPITQPSINETTVSYVEAGNMDLIPDHYYDYTSEDNTKKERRSFLDILSDVISNPLNKYSEKHLQLLKNKAVMTSPGLLILLPPLCF